MSLFKKCLFHKRFITLFILFYLIYRFFFCLFSTAFVFVCFVSIFHVLFFCLFTCSCVCVCINKQTATHTHTHTHIYIYIYIYMFIYIYIYIYIYIRKINSFLLTICLSDFDYRLRCSVGAVRHRIVWSSILLGKSRQTLLLSYF